MEQPKKHITLPLEGEALKYFEAAFARSGFKNISDYLRNLIRKDYEEYHCNKTKEMDI